MAGGGGGGGFFHGSAPQSYFSIGIDYAVTIGAGGASGTKTSPYTASTPGGDTSLAYSGGELRAAGGAAGAGQPFTSPRPAKIQVLDLLVDLVAVDLVAVMVPSCWRCR